MSEPGSRRRTNWIAVAVATTVMLFSYFSYGAAFTSDPVKGDSIDANLVAVALVVAPFVFVALAFVSQHPRATKQVPRAMGLLLVVALAIGLLDPLLGAACGFSGGAALCLRPPGVEQYVRWRVMSVVFTFLYCTVLFVVATPAGVLAGALVPIPMIGFADEYALWVARRDGVAAPA